MSAVAATFSIRKATLSDVPALERVIAESARGLSGGDYTEAQIEGALAGTFGVDSELIRDGTYFVAEAEGEVAGCGGWSRRRTRFGGDLFPGRQSEVLDPARDAARIRAFFVRPAWARRGIARALLARCEAEAAAQGFRALELMATLPGLRLYRALGYSEEAPIQHPLPDGTPMQLVPMRKEL